MNVSSTPISTLMNAANGFELDGGVTTDRISSAFVGDVNGDGKADILMPAYDGNLHGAGGALKVVYGQPMSAGAYPYSIQQVTDAWLNGTGTRGFEIISSYYIGVSTSLAVADVKARMVFPISLQGYFLQQLKCWCSLVVVRPRPGAGGHFTKVNAAYIDGTRAVEIDGPAANAYAGYSIAVVDFNKDGYADVLIGAPNYTANGVSKSGGAWGVWGKTASMWKSSPVINLQNVY